MVFIQDAFMFYNELDILDVRLHELYPVVDRFVLVEGTRTFTGKEKPLFFEENKGRYLRYLDKIVSVQFSDWPDSSDPWDFEAAHRNALIACATDLGGDDIIIFSDVDEIPSRESVETLRRSRANSFVFHQYLSYLKMNYTCTNLSLKDACWPIAERRKNIDKFLIHHRRWSRHQRIEEYFNGLLARDLEIMNRGGWHFSYFGDIDHVRNKIRNFSHQELNKEEFLAKLDINSVISSRLDLLGRGSMKWNVDNNMHLPFYIRDFPESRARFLV